jgi:hypothetical protein
MDSLLDTPVVTDLAIRSVNFFNGRLLSAEDMNLEKKANREARKQLGRAIGAGVAYGLEVQIAKDSTAADPKVTVQPGMAINPRGKVLELTDPVTLMLRRLPQVKATIGAPDKFEDCLPPQTGAYIVEEGIYLLTIGPADSGEKTAQTSGLGSTAVCNVKYKVDAVQFRSIPLTERVLSDLAKPGQVRNRVSHRCFGSADARLEAVLVNPFVRDGRSYGLLDDLLDAKELTRCETPLAILHWTAAGLQFIDLWAVRRRVTRPSATGGWQAWLTDRAASEAEAVFLQFQAQIEDIRLVEGNAPSVKAIDRFAFLPPLGVLPVAGTQGFKLETFFAGLTYRDPVVIEGAQVPSLIREAQGYPPIDVSAKEVFWLYAIRQNQQAKDLGFVVPRQDYLVFTTGHMPYRGDAHYNVNRWSYGNFMRE